MSAPVANIVAWASEHRVVIDEISAAVAELAAVMRRASAVGAIHGNSPQTAQALREVASEAERCTRTVRRAGATPPIPVPEVDAIFREMLAERRTWANQIRKAATRRDADGIDRANGHGDTATALSAQLEQAFRAAWPDVN